MSRWEVKIDALIGGDPLRWEEHIVERMPGQPQVSTRGGRVLVTAQVDAHDAAEACVQTVELWRGTLNGGSPPVRDVAVSVTQISPDAG